jgi:BirA family biotin operon repressor/biotin-[acetyl-CoA-carboxylase] ligase
MQLHPDAEASGVRLDTFDTIGSTNAEALARARAGERGPLWITAARQTAGRGRRGKAWISELGNLYASLLLTDAAPAVHLPELCFVMALAVRDAVSAVASSLSASLGLKWPNDLLLDGAKLAGILIEAESIGARTITAAGIGVNCAHHPDALGYPATNLAAHGHAVGPGVLMTELSRAMVSRFAQWDRGAGFGAIRAEWLTHAAGIGGDIHVRLSDRELTGIFETLDPAGRLMLRLPGGAVEAITAGEIFAPARVPA